MFEMTCVVSGVAERLFQGSLEFLLESYDTFGFFVERDLVWTLQKEMLRRAKQADPPLRVFNDFPMVRGARRSLSADLVVLDRVGRVPVAVEVKFEPSHSRSDTPRTKFPVVFWGMDGVAKDVEPIRQWIDENRADIGYSIFVDEGGYFRHRPAPAGAEWSDVGEKSATCPRLAVLRSRVVARKGAGR